MNENDDEFRIKLSKKCQEIEKYMFDHFVDVIENYNIKACRKNEKKK